MPYEWLLIALPVVFVLGWFAARLDIRHIRASAAELPRAYLRGLSELLSGSEERALDAFADIAGKDTLPTELQFTVGELSRRRGDYRRALKIHRQLQLDEKLPAADRNRALWELAQDCAAMGFVDASEQHARLLADFPDYRDRVFDFLLQNYQTRRRYAEALALIENATTEARQLHHVTAAHLYCQLAAQPDKPAPDSAALHRAALALYPACARARLALAAAAQAAAPPAPQAALAYYSQIAADTPQYLFLAVPDFARARAAHQSPAAAARALAQWLAAHPSPMLFRRVVAQLEQNADSAALLPALIADHLGKQCGLLAAAYYIEQEGGGALEQRLAAKKALLDAIPKAFKCHNCSYEMNHFDWQCPCCLQWESFRQQ